MMKRTKKKKSDGDELNKSFPEMKNSPPLSIKSKSLERHFISSILQTGKMLVVKIILISSVCAFVSYPGRWKEENF